MIFISKTRITFRIVFLLGLGSTVRLCPLQAMERTKENENDDQALVSQFVALKIAKKKSYTLFAQRYLETIDEIKKFQALGQKEKSEFLQRFLTRASELVNGKGCSIDNRDLVIKLGQESLKNLIASLDNEKKKTAQKIEKKIAKNGGSHHSLFQAAKAMLEFCYQEYSDQELLEEKNYTGILRNILNEVTIENTFEKELLIELLNLCDAEFNEQKESWKNSLLLHDLQDRIHLLYGYELEISSSEESHKSWNEDGQISDTQALSVAILCVLAMTGLMAHYSLSM